MIRKLTLVLLIAAGCLGLCLTGCAPKHDPLQQEEHTTVTTTTVSEPKLLVE